MRWILAFAPLFLTAGALAQEAASPKLVQEMFPRGEEACYAASLPTPAMKPRQTLSAFYLYRLFDPDPQAETVDFSRDEAMAFDRMPGNANWTDVIAGFSDSPHFYKQTVTCSEWEGSGTLVSCGVECDGGYFTARKTARGIDVAFDQSSQGLSFYQGCGEAEGIGKDRWLTPEDAGQSFSLARVPAAQCQAVVRELRHHDGLDPVPLRQRIAASGWRCLKRGYDAAHLKKHPLQKVTAIAVALKGPASVEKSNDSYPHTRLDVSLSFSLRDGSTARRDVSCGAGRTMFSCEGAFRLMRKDAKGAWLKAGEYDDPQAAQAPTMLDIELGRDDRTFRLDASTEADCSAN